MKKRNQIKIRIPLYSLIGDWILRLIYNSNTWYVDGEKNYLKSLKEQGTKGKNYF